MSNRKPSRKSQAKQKAASKRRLEAIAFDTAKDQPWRDHQPTSKQLSMLRRISRERGREFGGAMTRGRAHDIISEWKAVRGEGPLAKERTRAEAYHARKAA